MTTETNFLEEYDARKYPAFAVTSDIVLMTIRRGKLSVLLIERAGHPFQGAWALPGGFINIDESSENAAAREMVEETGVTVDDAYLEQLKTYSSPDRDPRMRVVSTAYIALVPHSELATPEAGSDAKRAQWFAVHDLLDPRDPEDAVALAFDHEQILRDGLRRVQSKLEYTALGTAFLDEAFTLADLRRIYEEVWNTTLHAANFRRKMLSVQNLLEEVGAKGSSVFGDGRSAQLYRRGSAELMYPPFMMEEVEV